MESVCLKVLTAPMNIFTDTQCSAPSGWVTDDVISHSID